MLRPLSVCLAGTLSLTGASAQPLAQRAYTGVILRDNPEGAVISRVRPGPFTPSDAGQALLRRNDLLVSANGRSVSSASFEELITELHPGDELSLIIRRGKPADPLAALPVGDPSGEELNITVKLESADSYTGTLGRLDGVVIVESSNGEFEKRTREIAVATKSWHDAPDGPQLESLLPYLTKVQRSARDAFVLPAIAGCFAQPLSVDAVASEFDQAVRNLVQRPDQLRIREFIEVVMSSKAAIPNGAVPSATAATQLARHLRDSVTIEGPESKALIATVNAAPAGVNEYVLSDKHWRNISDWQSRLRLAGATSPRTDFPPDLRDSFTGDILSFERLENGRYAVIGADGSNTYNMDVIEIIHDIGGNEIYYFRASPDSSANAINHIITDLSGNDEYISESDFRGPAVAVNGLSYIDDRSGDDVYRSSSQFAIASGLVGVGILLDRAGNDRYENRGPNSGWSIGAGIYGAGLVIDLAGDDAYTSEKLSQGAAGPFATAAIIDAQGNDTYTANGPSFPSAYKTPDTFLSMSQGFSMGIRGYASGGIGAIYDLDGNDHYNAGEFSQGCGYFFALGILHDAKGDDIYNGNRYSQAAAAHQAVGVLIDDAGNDRYTAKTAASQSGAWDQSITLLIDRAGDDTYTADDLCQGAAAQQALSLFFDLAGNDRYQAAGGRDSSPGIGPAAQGHSGSNEYHHDADRIFSFSLFSDVGGETDFFSTGRTGVMRTGAIDSAAPAKSRTRGIFSKSP